MNAEEKAEVSPRSQVRVRAGTAWRLLVDRGAHLDASSVKELKILLEEIISITEENDEL